MRSQRPASHTRSSVGSGYMHDTMKHVPFIVALLELIKNALDWGATRIEIDTEDDLIVSVRDNGTGMPQRNRDAFWSLARSTATGSRQTGAFDTGAKFGFMGWTTRMDVLTASEEEPEWVVRMGLRASEYQEAVFKNECVPQESVRKSRETWPFDHDYGSRIRWELDPSGKGIQGYPRGAKLREVLAARIGQLHACKVFVDGKRLPPVEVEPGTQPYIVQTEHRVLGTCFLHLYRRRSARKGTDALRMGDTHIAEVSVRQFLNALSTLQTKQVPPWMFHAEVFGHILVPYLKEHAAQTRDRFLVSVRDDPRTDLLLSYLEELGPQIAEALQLEYEQAEAQPDEHQLARRTLAHITKGLRGPDAPKIGGAMSNGDGGSSQASDKREKELKLQFPQQMEDGERLYLLVRPTDTTPDDAFPDNIEIILDGAPGLEEVAEKTRRSADGVDFALCATGLGPQLVRVRIRDGKSFIRNTVVVKERVPALHRPTYNTTVGQELWVLLDNGDKVIPDPGDDDFDPDYEYTRWTMTPSDGATLRGDNTTSGRLFCAQKPGLYTISVSWDGGSSSATMIVKPAQQVMPGDEGGLFVVGNELFALEAVRNMQWPGVLYLQAGDRDYTFPDGTCKPLHILWLNIRHPEYIEWRQENRLTVELKRRLVEAYIAFMMSMEKAADRISGAQLQAYFSLVMDKAHRMLAKK